MTGESNRRSLDRVLGEELDDLSSQGLLRKLKTITGTDNQADSIYDSRLVSFGSNDYLGLAKHPAIKAAQEDALRFGAGSTGSRLTSGNLAIHVQLEQAIAKFKHAADSALFSSGYSANIGAITALTDASDLIVSDSLNHASLIDGCRLSRAAVRIYRHCNVEHARELLADRDNFRRVLLITDGVFSMDGDLAPLPILADLCDEFDSWLMVDDAHGTGVYGATGGGIVEHFGLVDKVPIQMGTLSKAIGTSGGFVAGSQILAQFLRNKARSFVYSTAPSPASSAAALKALELIQTQPGLRRRLQENIVSIRIGLKTLGLTVPPGNSPIIPVIVGDADKAVMISNELEKKGIWIPAIRPPTVPPGTSRLRITVSAAHSDDDISRLIAALSSVSS
jgi:8-amino-7-oxononanoate synthase